MPLVLIHLVSGAHNDAVMAGLIVAGLVLAAAAQPETPGSARLVLAGVVLGLAVGVKATAIVVVPFAVLAALPGPDRRLRELWRPAVAVGGGLVLATVALAGLSGRGPGGSPDCCAAATP
ncbi:hypothetical protein Asp14428_26880 [Actinoplanes sp. NBRC 14428]|nr:hypothetical protein Asp14428_26880 [Actinoplanes sp. NBRC 14428]